MSSELIAWIQDRSREHDRDYREIEKFREIEKALNELSALKRKIAESPVIADGQGSACLLSLGGMDEPSIGKRVRIVRED